MVFKARKFKIPVSSILPCDAKELYAHFSIHHATNYVGVYTLNENMMVVYANFKNAVESPKIRLCMKGIHSDVGEVSTYRELEGKVQSEHGILFKIGRPKKGEMPDLKRKRKVPDRTTNLQPPTCLPKPTNVDNYKYIQDDIYKEMMSGEAGPDMFHAVWSSRDGLWFPRMWVGPHRNVRVTKRSSVKASVVDEILQEQENKCRLCQTMVFMGTYSNSDVDHIVPLKHGGSSSKGNLQVLCVTCHRRKTALECKKIMTRMGSPDIDWNIDKIYLTNTHVHYMPDSVVEKDPIDALVNLEGTHGLFVMSDS